ncbi:DUF4405 domain-containing protein [candidate division KSB1 bacterium]
MQKQPKKFHTRGFVSFVTTWTFLILAFSGIILYFTPKGRVANWMEWTLLGLTKEGWAGMHMIIALLFLISIILHIYFNWGVLMNYIRSKIRKSINLKKELVISLVVTGAFFSGALFELSPFWNLIDINEDIKNYWELKVLAPPVPHAEDLSLHELAKQRGETVELIIGKLKEYNIDIPDSNTTLADIAKENQSKPYILYTYLDFKKGQREQETGTGGAGGFGYGRMTIEDICKNNGIEITECLNLLKKNNITADIKDNVRRVALEHDLKPVELVDLLLGK